MTAAQITAAPSLSSAATGKALQHLERRAMSTAIMCLATPLAAGMTNGGLLTSTSTRKRPDRLPARRTASVEGRLCLPASSEHPCQDGAGSWTPVMICLTLRRSMPYFSAR